MSELGPRTDLWLRAASWLVPGAVRREWLAEWRAEMVSLLHNSRGHRRRPGCLEWTRAAAGALPDALWHLFDEWSPETMWHDLKHALRALRRRVSVTFLAVLVLGLGLGAALVVVSVVDAVLLRPLPFEEPERLVAVWEKNPTKDWYQQTAAPANAFDWRESAESFEEMAIYASWVSDLILEPARGEARRVTAATVGPRFFDVLRVPMAHGREFDEDDLWSRSEPAVVLSHELWTRAYGGDPGVLGESLVLEGVEHRVRGIAPPGFRLPEPDATEPLDLYLSFTWDEEAREQEWFRRAHFVRVVGRLSPGAGLDAARAELATIADRLEREYPGTNTDMGNGVTPLHEWVVGDTRRPLALVAAAVGLLLLVACANVASLMLLRAGGRRREIAVRSALGAGRRRLARLLALEGVLLAAAASAVGFAFARLCLRLLEHVPFEVPRLHHVSFEPRVLLVALGIALVACVGFSLAPALLGSRVDLRSALHAAAGRHSEGHGSVRTRRVLVVAEVALAVLLVVGSGLFVRSLLSLYDVDPGFDPEGVLSVRINVPGARYEEPAQVQALYDRIAERARALPGVVAVGQSRTLPVGGSTWTSDYALAGREGDGTLAQNLEVDEGYAEAVGLRLLAGRDFTAADRADAEPVALVSRALLRDILPAADDPRQILGERICTDEVCTDENAKTVVGVVEDIRFDGLARDVRPMIYHTLRQRPQWDRELFLRADTAGPAALATLATPLENVVREVDPGLPLMRVRTLHEVIDRSLARDRFLTVLLAAFGGLALVLALVGTYGVLASSVQLRRRELGIRAALGAARRDLEGRVLRQGLLLVGLGATVGLGLALLVARSIESQLFAIGGRDPLTYAAAAGLLLLTGALAAWLPARRAARVDPAEVLRSE